MKTREENKKRSKIRGKKDTRKTRKLVKKVKKRNERKKDLEKRKERKERKIRAGFFQKKNKMIENKDNELK